MATDLAARLEQAEPNAAEQASLLAELAELKLSEGDTDEAHRLLEQCYAIRQHTLTSGPCNGNQAELAPSHADSITAQEPNAGVQEHGESVSSEDDWESRDWEAAPAIAPTPRPTATSASGTATRGRGSARFSAAESGAEAEDDWEGDAASRRRHAPHVLEVYGLNSAITTTHLEQWLEDHQWAACMPPSVRWVDEEHALLVLPSPEAAQALLQAVAEGKYKVRPFAQASAGAMDVAAEDLTPPRAGPRPKTTTAVARLLISAALGNKQLRDRDAEKELAQMRRDKRQEQHARQAAMEAAWGGDD